VNAATAANPRANASSWIAPSPGVAQARDQPDRVLANVDIPGGACAVMDADLQETTQPEAQGNAGAQSRRQRRMIGDGRQPWAGDRRQEWLNERDQRLDRALGRHVDPVDHRNLQRATDQRICDGDEAQCERDEIQQASPPDRIQGEFQMLSALRRRTAAAQQDDRVLQALHPRGQAARDCGTGCSGERECPAIRRQDIDLLRQ
jgi:hypothetical protein